MADELPVITGQAQKTAKVLDIGWSGTRNHVLHLPRICGDALCADNMAQVGYLTLGKRALRQLDTPMILREQLKDLP